MVSEDGLCEALLALASQLLFFLFVALILGVTSYFDSRGAPHVLCNHSANTLI